MEAVCTYKCPKPGVVASNKPIGFFRSGNMILFFHSSSHICGQTGQMLLAALRKFIMYAFSSIQHFSSRSKDAGPARQGPNDFSRPGKIHWVVFCWKINPWKLSAHPNNPSLELLQDTGYMIFPSLGNCLENLFFHNSSHFCSRQLLQTHSSHQTGAKCLFQPGKIHGGISSSTTPAKSVTRQAKCFLWPSETSSCMPSPHARQSHRSCQTGAK